MAPIVEVVVVPTSDPSGLEAVLRLVERSLRGEDRKRWAVLHRMHQGHALGVQHQSQNRPPEAVPAMRAKELRHDCFELSRVVKWTGASAGLLRV